jgi:hypothetical protein
MRLRERIGYWAGGWAALARHDGVAGYGTRSLPARLRLELAVMRAALASPRSWRAAWICAALGLGAQILVWRHDLVGWRRDALQCLPLACIAPWVAAGRRRRLQRLLARASSAHETAVTVPPAAPLQSSRREATERRRWPRFFTARWPGTGASASDGSISCWWSRASACWRRWRCRASRT